jgi:hypothetical protein
MASYMNEFHGRKCNPPLTRVLTVPIGAESESLQLLFHAPRVSGCHLPLESCDHSPIVALHIVLQRDIDHLGLLLFRFNAFSVRLR